MSAADTSHCPVNRWCESCGTGGQPNRARTVRTPAGVLCLTNCPTCAERPALAPFTAGTTTRFIAQHHAHTNQEHQ